MQRGLWGRFAVWTIVLVLIAAALYLSGVGTVAVVVVMFVAWLSISAIEVALARAASRRRPQVVGRSVAALLDEAGHGETVRVIRREEGAEAGLAQDDGPSLDAAAAGAWPQRPPAEREPMLAGEAAEELERGPETEFEPWVSRELEGFRVLERRPTPEEPAEPEPAAEP